MPPLKKGKIVSKSGNVVNAKDDSELGAKSKTLAKPKPTPRGGPGAKIQKQGSLSTAKAVKKYRTDPGKDFKGVGYIPPKTGGGTLDINDKKKKKKKGPSDAVTIAGGTTSKSSGLVDDINLRESYFAEARRIVLALVGNAKDLLIRYNFTGISRVQDYYLDADRESISQAVASSLSRPEPPFSLSDVEKQDRFSFAINQINNKISDTIPLSEKTKYFGTLKGGVFRPKEIKILNGNSYYDMRFEFDTIYSDVDLVIKCYEVS